MKVTVRFIIKRIIYYILPALSIFLLLLMWTAVAESQKTIPNPFEVFERFKRLQDRPISNTGIIGHIWASLQRVLKALGISILLGIPFGLLIGWSESFRYLFKPLFEIFRPIPAIAWIPLVSIWFGVGEASKITIVFLGAVMPIVVNTYTGVSMVPKLLTDAAKSFGASHGQLLTDIVLPSSLQAIFAGIKTALGIGWMVVLAAEMISAKSGLGFLIIRGSDSDDIALTMVSMVFIGVIGALLSTVCNLLERRICPWTNE